jgi:hypothetical protein
MLSAVRSIILGAKPNLLKAGAWTMSVAGGTTTAVESPPGTITITGDGANQGRGDQSITTIIGVTYRVLANVAGQAAGLRVGNTQGSSALINLGLNAGAASVTFVATAATTWVRFDRTGASSTTVTSISLKRA